MTASASDLAAIVRDDLLQAVPAEASALAQSIVEAHGDAVVAVLFYGSCLRTMTAEGVLDFYVLVDDYRAYHGRRVPAALNRLLPPTVSLWRLEPESEAPRAKVAVISRRQFARRMRPGSLDTSLWSRFCQPAALVYAQDPAVVAWVAETLGQAVSTAALWAARLGPDCGTPDDFWMSLFRHTYGAELRAEARSNRAKNIHDAAPERYARLLVPALTHAGVRVDRAPGKRLCPRLPRRPVAGAWALRRVIGKALSMARLAKASFTFAGGTDYIVWKIERHTKQPIHLTPWQRRHPLLAAPLTLWRLWRRGLIR